MMSGCFIRGYFCSHTRTDTTEKKNFKKKTPMPKEHLNQILGTVALFFTFVTTNALIFAKILFQEALDL